MWDTFFRDGGWGMYPTLIFGFLLIAVGVLCIWRPERRFLPLLGSLATMTFGAGLLGTCVGIVKSFHFLPDVPEPERVAIGALGVAESLSCVVLALMLVVFAGMLCAVAALRAARRSQTA